MYLPLAHWKQQTRRWSTLGLLVRFKASVLALFPLQNFTLCAFLLISLTDGVDGKKIRLVKCKQRPNLFHIHLFILFSTLFFFSLLYSYQLDAFVASCLRSTMFSFYITLGFLRFFWYFFNFSFHSLDSIFIRTSRRFPLLVISLYQILPSVFFLRLFFYLIVYFMHYSGACSWSINEITLT